MNAAYLVGHIVVKDAGKWNQYRAQVPATLQPWGAEITFRGKLVEVLSGEHSFDDIFDDIVVIRFPDKESIQGWHTSPAYQALLPLRRQAAEMLLLAYDTPPI